MERRRCPRQCEGRDPNECYSPFVWRVALVFAFFVSLINGEIRGLLAEEGVGLREVERLVQVVGLVEGSVLAWVSCLI